MSVPDRIQLKIERMAGILRDGGQPGAMQRLCEFLGIAYHGQVMPHLNRSGSDSLPPGEQRPEEQDG